MCLFLGKQTGERILQGNDVGLRWIGIFMGSILVSHWDHECNV